MFVNLLLKGKIIRFDRKFFFVHTEYCLLETSSSLSSPCLLLMSSVSSFSFLIRISPLTSILSSLSGLQGFHRTCTGLTLISPLETGEGGGLICWWHDSDSELESDNDEDDNGEAGNTGS